MKNLTKSIVPTLVLGAILGLAGCAPGPNTGVLEPPQIDPNACDLGSTSQQGQCEMTGARSTVKLPTSVSGPVGAALVNFNDFFVSLNGSTVVFPTSGTFTLNLKNSVGNTIAASTFGWSKQGNALVPTSPTIIQSWVASTGGTFKELAIEIDPTMVAVEPGLNVIMLSPTMDQTILGASGTIWTMGESCQSGPFSMPDISLCP